MYLNIYLKHYLKCIFIFIQAIVPFVYSVAGLKNCTVVSMLIHNGFNFQLLFLSLVIVYLNGTARLHSSQDKTFINLDLRLCGLSESAIDRTYEQPWPYHDDAAVLLHKCLFLFYSNSESWIGYRPKRPIDCNVICIKRPNIRGWKAASNKVRARRQRLFCRELVASIHLSPPHPPSPWKSGVFGNPPGRTVSSVWVCVAVQWQKRTHVHSGFGSR